VSRISRPRRRAPRGRRATRRPSLPTVSIPPRAGAKTLGQLAPSFSRPRDGSLLLPGSTARYQACPRRLLLRPQHEKGQRTDDDDGKDDDDGMVWHALALDPAKAGPSANRLGSRSVGHDRVIFASKAASHDRSACSSETMKSPGQRPMATPRPAVMRTTARVTVYACNARCTTVPSVAALSGSRCYSPI
jgi:hypothetical protein